MSVELPAKVQNQILQYQQIQQQLQLIASQRAQISSQLEELKATLDELGKVRKGTPVYKVSGSILVKVQDLDALKKEMEEHKETATVKVTSLERQEKQLKERFINLQQEITKAMQGQGSAE